MRRERRRSTATAQERDNRLIIFGLLLAFAALLVTLKFVPPDQSREIFMLLSAIISGIMTHLNSSQTSHQEGASLSAGTVENVTMETPADEAGGTQELKEKP
jgi:hypothetical protein